jgi:hypothetical protein
MNTISNGTYDGVNPDSPSVRNMSERKICALIETAIAVKR